MELGTQPPLHFGPLSGQNLSGMHQLLGRWDLVVGEGKGLYPSWVELTPRGGRFVGRVGSSRPITKVEYSSESVKFTVAPQYESRTDDLVFNGLLRSGRLVGKTVIDDGSLVKWFGFPAPDLPAYEPSWREPTELVCSDLSHWTPRSPDWVSNWSILDGMLVNSAAGSDLVTTGKFGDFRLTAEYQYPSGSNSGIYLRGRYELQIVDDFIDGHHGPGNSGAIYGFLSPSKNAIKPAGEWNTAEVTLIGRFVTVVLNGETVIDNQEIPGITGGALNSDEGAAGPLFLQGDHGPVTFRRLTVTPGLRL